MKTANFFHSVKKGTPLQMQVMERLKRWMQIKHFEYGQPESYDILVELDNATRKYLVLDAMQEPFKNYIAIPFAKNSEPFGITKPTADFLVYKIKDSFFQISVAKLKTLIEEKAYRFTDKKESKKEVIEYYLFPVLVLKDKMYKL